MSSTDICREPSCGGILHTSNWEETQGQTQNTHLVWEHLWIPQEELEDVAREEGCQCYFALLAANGYMDGYYLQYIVQLS